MAQVAVGTSGYAYHEWVGPVYPQGTVPDEYLARYGELFSTVELNFTYHRMPSADELLRLADQAPGLLFSAKANEALTHRMDPADWRASAAVFKDALEPLRRDSRLAAVLLQFPPGFRYDLDRRRYLDSLLKEFSGFPLAVEFGNPGWYNNRVLDALRERCVALAALDLPALEGLPPLLDVVTSPLAYLRLNGRNGETWWGSDSASRYDYLYSDAELSFFGERIRALSAGAERVLVYFNNSRRGQAAVNARSLIKLLSRMGLLP